MSTKKFKSNVQTEGNLQVDQLLKLPSVTIDRALITDGSGNVTQSDTTSTELATLSGVTGNVQSQLDSKIPSTEKGAANGVATLNADSKIPSSQLPAISITEVFVVADITARDALTVGTGDGEVQEGDVVRVADASADPNINSGSASYIYDGTGYLLLKSGDDVVSVNGATGTVVLDTGDISENGNLYFTDERAQDAVGNNLTDGTTVDFTYDDVAGTITAEVNITNATLVDAIDDSDEVLIYDSSTAAIRKVTRVDLVGNPGSDGDIPETSFSMANNVTVAADVTGLAFASATVRSFEALVSVEIDALANLYEVFKLHGIQKDSQFDMSVESTGDNSQVVFSITSAGQVQYTSGDISGFLVGDIKFRAITLTV